MPRPASASGALSRLRAGAAVVLLVLLGSAAASSPAGPAPASRTGAELAIWTALRPGAVAEDFEAGRIMDDAIFFDGDAHGPVALQALLEARVPECAGTAVPCLRDYVEDTGDVAADAQCDAVVGRPAQSASSIVSAVGRACDVNPAVLLVLLQKEQSLVTDPAPGERQYRSATGYGCPDTADCDSDYYGFFGQVYGAAWQFQRYRDPASSFDWYPVGEVSTIAFSPDAACGGAPVRIENAATAGLYYYTPYQPNAAALADLYGSGDACSAYGNRNFWRLYSDWFGDPTPSAR